MEDIASPLMKDITTPFLVICDHSFPHAAFLDVLPSSDRDALVHPESYIPVKHLMQVLFCRAPLDESRFDLIFHLYHLRNILKIPHADHNTCQNNKYPGGDDLTLQAF